MFLSTRGWEPQNTVVRKMCLCPPDVSMARASFPANSYSEDSGTGRDMEELINWLSRDPEETKGIFFNVTLLEEQIFSLEPTSILFPLREETAEMITY